MFRFLLRLLDLILPPPQWRLPVALVVAATMGIGAVVFVKSKAHSYMFDNPKACINCHIMTPQYVSWFHSSHAQVATCNDCHVPQDNIFKTFLHKALDGGRHSALFTIRAERQAIQAIDASKNVIQGNCVRCHDFVNFDVSTKVNLEQIHQGQGKACWDCHAEVPHGVVRSLSSVPNAKMQLETPKLPSWLEAHLHKDAHKEKQGGY